jgi:hypothetical protein
VRSDAALQAAKELKRRVFEALGSERALSYASAYLGRELDIYTYTYTYIYIT